jgi:hypothetical protein
MTASQQPISAITSSYIIRTKDDDCRRTTQDVGGPTVEVAREPGHQPEPILKVQDPFLYYSNDQVRMKELRFCQDEEDDSSDDGSSSTSLSNQEQPTSTCVRKTRISFELHPSLLLEDLDEELFGDDFLNFDDILNASLVSNEQGSDDVVDVINSLRQIMFG